MAGSHYNINKPPSLMISFPCSGKPVEVPHWELPPSKPAVTPGLLLAPQGPVDNEVPLHSRRSAARALRPPDPSSLGTSWLLYRSDLTRSSRVLFLCPHLVPSLLLPSKSALPPHNHPVKLRPTVRSAEGCLGPTEDQSLLSRY